MSRRALIRATIAASAAAALAPFSHVLAAPGVAPAPTVQIYFPETGHNIGFKFRLFYERNGGLELFGLPLTEVFTDGATQVQYFERARFELRPDLADSVALSLLGSELTASRTDPAFQWLSGEPENGRKFFPESGHSIGGAFLEYWQRKNGLIAFGYPISEELSETSSDGVERVVQYFQRARFELHPEAAFTPNAIQLGHLGRQALDIRPRPLQWRCSAVRQPVSVVLPMSGAPMSNAPRHCSMARSCNQAKNSPSLAITISRKHLALLRATGL